MAKELKSHDIRQNTSRNTHQVVADLLFEEADTQHVLDIPSGEGSFTQRLVEQGVKVRAADCVDLLKVPGVSCDICDMNKSLPYEPETFDSVVCIDGIEHLERPFDFVRECSRIVKKDGSLIVSTPNITALRSRWRWLLTGFHNKCKRPLDEGNPTPLHHISMLSFPEVRYMLHTNGFLIEEIRTNRVKAIGWVYALLVPLAWIITWRTFRREEKDREQQKRNRTILRQMFSLLFSLGKP